MKKNILILLLGLLAVTVQAQFTNGMKDSALPQASSVIANDRVRILHPQNGTNGNYTATVGQIIGDALAANLATTNGLAALLATEISARVALGVSATNYTAAVSNAVMSALIATNSALASALGAEVASRVSGVSNSTAYTVAVSNTVFAALVATNAVLAGQVAAVAAGAGQSITNGGAVTFATVTAPNVLTPQTQTYSFTNSNVSRDVALNVDMTAGAFQFVNFTCNGTGGIMTVRPVNAANGQNVSLVIAQLGNLMGYTLAGAVYSTNKLFAPSAAPAGTIASGKTALVQLQMFGTNAVISYSPL